MVNYDIIMPLYKRTEFYIQRAIDSVIKQSFTGWQLYVVDDNDDQFYKDISLEMERKYSKYNNIKWIYHLENRGANTARNTGVYHSNNPYIAFIDSDDEWNETYLETVYQKIISNFNADIISSAYYTITDYNKTFLLSTYKKDGYLYETELLGDVLSPTSAIVVKRASLLNAGSFDEGMVARQDYDTWLRILENGGYVMNVQTPLVLIYRNGHDSISRDYLKHIQGTLNIYDKIIKNNSLDPSLKKKACKSQIAYISSVYARNGEVVNCLKYLLNSMKYGCDPRSFGYTICNLLSYYMITYLPKNLYNIFRQFYDEFVQSWIR